MRPGIKRPYADTTRVACLTSGKGIVQLDAAQGKISPGPENLHNGLTTLC